MFISIRKNILKKTNTLNLEMLNKNFNDFNRPATGLEILFEMIEHSVHHRGQLVLLFRLYGKEPPLIKYII